MMHDPIRYTIEGRVRYSDEEKLCVAASDWDAIREHQAADADR